MRKRKNTSSKDEFSNSKKFRPKHRLKKFNKNERRKKWHQAKEDPEEDESLKEK